MCAKTLGDLRRSYVVYFGEKPGKVSVYEDGVEIDSARRIMVAKNYVAGVERTGAAALNKCSAKIEYYDMFGSKNAVNFLMHEDDFRALKSDLQK